MAYQKHLAEVEELRALERSVGQAAHEVLVLRAALLDAQLDRQRAQLAWHALGLTRGIELVDSFRIALRAIIHNVADPLQIIRQITVKLKVTPCEAIDWATFDAEFRSTYPEFQSKLITRYSELTEIEMRVNVLLKLNIISPDIAMLLCISERGVKAHRLRIRTKLGLAQDEDIDKVLAAI